MSDQASQLRQLVLRAARQRDAESLPPPRIVAVLGPQRGVGVTTIAANLGRALVEQAVRVVMIDADRGHTDLARVCGREPIPESFNPSVARRDIHEALLPAPGGLQVVPGIWEPESEIPLNKAAGQLLRQFQQLGRHADTLVLDLGAGPADLLRLWRDAIGTFLVVTTPSAPDVMQTYTLIKQSLAGTCLGRTELLVNLARDEREGTDVFRRVDRSCRRFLGMGVQAAGHVAASGDVAASLSACAVRWTAAWADTTSRRAA